MEIVNIVVIALLLSGVYLGYQRGLLKELTDFLILFLSSLLSGKLSDILVGLLYKYIPFLILYLCLQKAHETIMCLIFLVFQIKIYYNLVKSIIFE